MAGQMHIATDDERGTMLAGLLRAKVRDLRAARDVEQDAIRHCNARVRKIESALRAAMSNAAMCGVEIEQEAAAPSDLLFAECSSTMENAVRAYAESAIGYTRDPAPFTATETARMTGLEP